MDDALLSSLGMSSRDERRVLIETFEFSLKIFSPERVDALSAFLGMVAECVGSVRKLQAIVAESGERASVLNKSLSSAQSDAEQLAEMVKSSDSRSADLSAVNLKQMDGLAAFKEKTDRLKLRLTDAWSEIKQLKSDIAVADLSLNSPCAMCSDLRSDKAALEQQLSDTRQRASMRLHCAEVVSHFKRKAGSYKRQMLKAKCNWTKWSKRGKAIRSECELKVSLVVSERDAALADNVVYIDQILAARKELSLSRNNTVALMEELSTVKADLSRYLNIERSIRMQFFMGSDGREKICPVPAENGAVIPLIDIYRGWLRAETVGDEGREVQFKCPSSGIY